MSKHNEMTVQESLEIDQQEFEKTVARRYSEYEQYEADCAERGKLSEVIRWANTARSKALVLDQFLKGQPNRFISDGEVEII